MQIILVKLTLYVTEIAKKQAFHHLFPGKTPLMLQKMPPPPKKKKKKTISMLYLLQAQPALAILLLACYCGFTTICNCVDTNQTDSYGAG